MIWLSKLEHLNSQPCCFTQPNAILKNKTSNSLGFLQGCKGNFEENLMNLIFFFLKNWVWLSKTTRLPVQPCCFTQPNAI